MTTTRPIYQKTIVRLWMNPKYGQGTGPKKINTIVFNGAIEFPDLRQKFFADLAQMDEFKKVVRPEDAALAAELIHSLFEKFGWSKSSAADIYVSQLFAIQPKSFIEGFIFFNWANGDCIVLTFDDSLNLHVHAKLSVCACIGDKKGNKSPDFFGANFELEPRTPQAVSRAETVLARFEEIRRAQNG